MFRFSRRLRRLLHGLVLASLALALIVQPVLSDMGEMHELTHGLAESHVHAEGHDTLVDELAEADESEDRGAGVLHVVHHLAHCCGQASAVAPTLSIPTRLPVATEVAALVQRPHAASPLLAPFRPPIAA
jgi:hypothetical protein